MQFVGDVSSETQSVKDIANALYVCNVVAAVLCQTDLNSQQIQRQIRGSNVVALLSDDLFNHTLKVHAFLVIYPVSRRHS